MRERKEIMMSRKSIVLAGASLLLLGTWLNLPVTAEPKVIKITAKKYEFSPKEITLKKGETVTLQLTSLDRKHGFSAPALNVRSDITPGKVTELKVTPKEAGTTQYYCDVFCGSGHDDMTGTLKVTD